jgi:hypothetical protein
MAKRRQPVDRVARAKTLTVTRITDIHYRVTGGESAHDVIVLGDGTLQCDCPDNRKSQMTCAHIIATTWAREREAAGNVLEEGRDVPFPEPIDEEDVDAPMIADPPSAVVGIITPPTEPPAGGRAHTRAAAPAVQAPWSNEAEQAVLGAMLLDQDAVLKAAAILDDTMFYREGHRLLFRSMLSLTGRGDVLDPVTLRNELERRGDLDRVGGMEYIAVLIDVVPIAANVTHHADIVREKAHRRVAAQAGLELTAAAMDPTVDLANVRQAYDRAGELRTESVAGRFRLLTVRELLALPAPAWLLDRYLPVNGLSVLYGAPGSGKSFLALAWAMSIAAGRPWIDHPTQPGTVVYVAAEGSSGLGQRVSAYADSHELVGPDGIHFVREPVNLRESRDVDAFLAGVAPLKPQFITCDTLARCMEGSDENSSEDMGRVVGSVDRIRRVTGAHVLLVHHAGWSTNERPRGHSSLVGAADAVFLLQNDAGVLTLEFSKPHKDAPPVEPLQLRLVAAGSSCVIEPQDSLSAIGALEKMQRVALEALDAIDAGDGATHSDWKAAAMETKHGKVSMSRATFSRCLKRLVRAGLITKDKKSKRYSLTGKGISACSVS